MTTPVPGPAASVLSAILVTNPNDPNSPLSVAVFSQSGEAPLLPSLSNDVVAMPQDGLLDANGTWTGFLSTQGLAGATAPARWVGSTASGKPTSGTFSVGDFVVSADGNVYVCTVAGTPGTWIASGSQATGSVSGDLTGTYPSPTVTNTHLATQSISSTATLGGTSAPVVLTDTTTAAFTLTLPSAPTAGRLFTIVDDTGKWNTHTLTIGRNGKNIDGAAANLSLTTQFGKVTLYYDGTAWWTLSAWPPATPGLQYLTGGGTITATTISNAQSAGYQGLFLDPRFVWDASGLVINGVQNFVIESRMVGSIGWLGHISYNTGGYITTSTGAPADGIQVYASAPSTSQTQGVVFRNCVLVGSNSNAVVHFGGGQRRCGLVDTLVYNTSSATGAYGVITDTGLSANNSEDMIFSFSGGGGIAGAYAALGIGTAGSSGANDTTYYDLATSGGTYGIVKTTGGNHTFHNYYDRSSPTTATVWNHGGARMTFIGGEDQNGTGLSHLIDNSTAQTVLISRMVTQAGATTTCQVSAGALVVREACIFNQAQTVALSGTGTVDLDDPAINAASATISGSAGTLILASTYTGTGSSPILTSWTGTTSYELPAVVATARGTGVTTTQTLSWTPPAVVGTRFRVSVMIRPTVAGTSTVPVLGFTEIGGSAQSFTIPMWQGNSSATSPSYTCAVGGASFYGTVESDTDGTATAITLTITPTGSTFRYSAVIERLT